MEELIKFKDLFEKLLEAFKHDEFDSKWKEINGSPFGDGICFFIRNGKEIHVMFYGLSYSSSTKSIEIPIDITDERLKEIYMLCETEINNFISITSTENEVVITNKIHRLEEEIELLKSKL